MSDATSPMPALVDAREHRAQLGVVGASVLALSVARRPGAVLAFAGVTAFPVIPLLFRRIVAPRLGPTVAVEDARLPACARLAGGVALAVAAGAAVVAPSAATYGALAATGALCVYGAATGYCVPCNLLLTLERSGLVELDPPLVCSVRL